MHQLHIHRFKKFPLLRGHMVIHTHPHRFKCQFCSSRFRTQRAYTSHQRKHLDYYCDICHKKFTSAFTLKVPHFIVHTYQNESINLICYIKITFRYINECMLGPVQKCLAASHAITTLSIAQRITIMQNDDMVK